MVGCGCGGCGSARCCVMACMVPYCTDGVLLLLAYDVQASNWPQNNLSVDRLSKQTGVGRVG